MKEITVNDILTSGYCDDYDEARIRRLWGKRETANALDILDSHLPYADRVWLVLTLNMLGDEALYTFRAALAHFCADIYERYYPDDDRVRKCAEAWHALACGEDVDMRAAMSAALDAAYDASWSAAWDAARSASWSTAWDASWSAAWSAAWDAAWDAARSASWDAAWDAAFSASFSAAWDAAFSASYEATTMSCIVAWMRDIVEVYEL